MAKLRALLDAEQPEKGKTISGSLHYREHVSERNSGQAQRRQ